MARYRCCRGLTFVSRVRPISATRSIRSGLCTCRSNGFRPFGNLLAFDVQSPSPHGRCLQPHSPARTSSVMSLFRNALSVHPGSAFLKPAPNIILAAARPRERVVGGFLKLCRGMDEVFGTGSRGAVSSSSTTVETVHTSARPRTMPWRICRHKNWRLSQCPTRPSA